MIQLAVSAGMIISDSAIGPLLGWLFWGAVCKFVYNK